MPTGGGGTRPADAGQATASCSGGHPPATAVSAVRTPIVQTATFWIPTAVRGATVDGQGVRGVRFGSRPDTGRGVRLGQDGGGPAAAVAARRQDRADRIFSSALVKWPGRRSQRRTAIRIPGARTPRHCGHPRPPQGMGTLRQRPRWTASGRTVHHPAAMSDQQRDWHHLDHLPRWTTRSSGRPGPEGSDSHDQQAAHQQRQDRDRVGPRPRPAACLLARRPRRHSRWME
jgi:hypothetical protein